MRTVLVPQEAGVLSALGMLLTDRVRDYAAGVLGSTAFEAAFRRLERQARADMPGAALERRADLRYRGQSYELTVPWKSADRSFAALHHRIYGYQMNSPMEVVTLRVRARIHTHPAKLVRSTAEGPAPSSRRVWTSGKWRHVSVTGRGNGHGPALILDYGSTVLVPPGWTFQTDRSGMLILRRK